MASTYIKRTCDGAYTSIFTWSAWVKRSATGSYHGLFCNKKNDSNSNSRVRFYFSDADRLAMEVKDSTSGDDSFFQTNRLFRDVNAWYHIVLAYDTTESAENDRIKLWVNNEEITSWEQFNRASSNFGTLWSSAMEHRIGTQNANSGTNYYFDGSMSHVHLTYGTAYTPSAFGETDSTTGEWKIKTSPSVTYGSQGYFVLKDGNSLTDQSGQSNNFTVGGGTLTKTEDNPSNVFATLNPLSTKSITSRGNTTAEYGSSSNTYETTTTTLGMTSGKYYCECKITIDQALPAIGISATNANASNTLGSEWLGASSDTYGYWINGTIYNNGSSIASGQSTFATNDIMGMALDLDSTQNTLKYYKNGSLVSTVNVTTNSNGWLFGTTHETGKSGARSKFNFGNGYFEETAVSSAGTNASENGIFEYDVPTGYTALSTKGLNL
jgi:hypothetical protein